MAGVIPQEVQSVFDSYPQAATKQLLKIRELIYQCAASDQSIGEITETLKWGEPAYLTGQTGSGSTIRLGYKDKQPDKVAVYFHCQTSIVKDIQKRYKSIECVDNRALLLQLNTDIPAELADCLMVALTYHQKGPA